MHSHEGNLTVSAYLSDFINVEILRRFKSGLLSKSFTLITAHLKVFKLKPEIHLTRKEIFFYMSPLLSKYMLSKAVMNY